MESSGRSCETLDAATQRAAWGLRIEPRTTFNPPDEKLPAVLEILQRPDFTLEMCADEFQVTLPALCAFLTSDRGLALLAHTELAQAIHIRAIAIARLPHVIDAMTYALQDFANTCRNVPLNPKSMQSLEFVERAKETARKNGHLLLRLAHFSPRPLRSYAPPSGASSPRARGEDRLAAGQAGEGNEAHLNAHAVEFNTDAAPMPNRNPTRERGVTPSPHAQPTSANQSHTSSPQPALTSPERQRVGAPTHSVASIEPAAHPRHQLACPTPAPTPVPLTISAAPRSELTASRFHPSAIPHPTSDIPSLVSHHRPQTVPP